MPLLLLCVHMGDPILTSTSVCAIQLDLDPCSKSGWPSSSCALAQQVDGKSFHIPDGRVTYRWLSCMRSYMPVVHHVASSSMPFSFSFMVFLQNVLDLFAGRFCLTTSLGMV